MATSTIDSIDWNACYANLKFEKTEEVYDEKAEEITKKQCEKQETRTRQARVRLDSQVARQNAIRFQKDLEALDSELLATRSSLLNRGVSI